MMKENRFDPSINNNFEYKRGEERDTKSMRVAISTVAIGLAATSIFSNINEFNHRPNNENTISCPGQENTVSGTITFEDSRIREDPVVRYGESQNMLGKIEGQYKQDFDNICIVKNTNDGDWYGVLRGDLPKAVSESIEHDNDGTIWVNYQTADIDNVSTNSNETK